MWSIRCVFVLCLPVFTIAGQACRNGKSDILFIVDDSSSITVKEFDTIRNFIGKVMYSEVTTLGPGHSQAGLVVFSNEVVANIPFNMYHGPKEFVDALNNLEYSQGETYLGKALTFARTKALTSENGLRTDVSHILIILTDGRATDEDLAKQEIQALHKIGVFTIMVGLGKDLDDRGLQEIAYRTDDIVNIKDWKSLDEIVAPLRKCKSKKPKVSHCDKSLKANVVFVVDSSTSLGAENFKRLKNFIVEVTNSFPVIGKDGVQVGLLQYSSYGRRTHVAFNLNKYSSKSDLQKAIKALKWTMGGTKTGYALKMADRKLMRNARKGVKNIFIVLTDGRASDNVKFAAKKLHEKMYTVLAVGIGKEGTVDKNELKAIASKPEELHIFHPKNFSELPSFLSSLTSSVCHGDQEEFESKQQKAVKKPGIGERR